MSAGWQGPAPRRKVEGDAVKVARLVTAVGTYLARSTTGNHERLRAAYEDVIA